MCINIICTNNKDKIMGMFSRKIYYILGVICRFITFGRLCKFAVSGYFSTEGGAIDGADAVAYFTEDKMVMGLKSISTEWEGATWYFSSKENRELFIADPLKYAPQYGGFCAFGITEGMTVKSQADSWSIVDDKLYLNYDPATRELWEENKETLVEEADETWSEQRSDNKLHK